VACAAERTSGEKRAIFKQLNRLLFFVWACFITQATEASCHFFSNEFTTNIMSPVKTRNKQKFQRKMRDRQQHFFLAILVIFLFISCVNCDAISVSISGEQRNINLTSSNASNNNNNHQNPIPFPVRVTNLEHFSEVLTTSFAEDNIGTKFIFHFTNDKTEFVGFPFEFHKSIKDSVTKQKLKFKYTGSNEIENGFKNSKHLFFDMALHCTGRVYTSGPYEACESMWLYVQMAHLIRLQVHGINLLEMVKFNPADMQSSPKIVKWSSYLNQGILDLQAFNEVNANEYRRYDAEFSTDSPSGIVYRVLKQFISSHEVIPIGYYSIKKMTEKERNQKRSEYQPEFFIPILFNSTGKGFSSGFFTDDVEFAVPISNTVRGLKNAKKQYQEFMKNVERAFLYIEGPLHVQEQDPESPDIIRAAVPLTYTLFKKNDYPKKRVVCQGIAFMEVNKKNQKQFSSFKYIFDENSVLLALGNRSNVQRITIQRKK
jgi:hypothetical protein